MSDDEPGAAEHDEQAEPAPEAAPMSEPPAPRSRMSRRKLVAFGLASALIVGGCTTTALLVVRDDGTATAQDDNPLLTSTSLRVTSTSTTETTTTEPLPIPEAPPNDPHAPSPIIDIGGIRIPKIGLEHRLYEGITLTVINHGPGHWPGSAMPGQRGNSVFPGHRTTYSKPFNQIDQLVVGDEIVFDMPEAVYVYHVNQAPFIVAPTDLWVTDPSPTPTVTLVACHPKGSARQRIVVKADLAGTFPK